MYVLSRGRRSITRDIARKIYILNVLHRFRTLLRIHDSYWRPIEQSDCSNNNNFELGSVQIFHTLNVTKKCPISICLSSASQSVSLPRSKQQLVEILGQIGSVENHSFAVIFKFPNPFHQYIKIFCPILSLYPIRQLLENFVFPRSHLYSDVHSHLRSHQYSTMHD